MISVIVPTYNTAPNVLARLWASLKAQTYQDFEVVIYDDSTTQTGQQQVYGMCSDERYRIRYFRPHVPSGGNIGYVKRMAFSLGLGDIDVDFTFSVADVSDIERRNTSYSKTIILPNTAKNQSLFGNIFDISVNNDYYEEDVNIGQPFRLNYSAQTTPCYFADPEFKPLRAALLDVVDDHGRLNSSLYGTNPPTTFSPSYL